MRTAYLTLCLLLATSLSAQFGIQLNITQPVASETEFDGSGEVPERDYNLGQELSINYWFRLPNQRVEFLPTLRFGLAEQAGQQFQLAEYGADFKVNVYPFDFLGDCDCPTFGKQGPQLQKGFFLQLAGGYSFYDAEFGAEVKSPNRENGSSFTYGGALGLDIGLSNLITLTPIVGVRTGTSPFQETELTLPAGPTPVIHAPKLTTFHAGLLVSFRLDHKKY